MASFTLTPEALFRGRGSDALIGVDAGILVRREEGNNRNPPPALTSLCPERCPVPFFTRPKRVGCWTWGRHRAIPSQINAGIRDAHACLGHERTFRRNSVHILRSFDRNIGEISLRKFRDILGGRDHSRSGNGITCLHLMHTILVQPKVRLSS